MQRTMVEEFTSTPEGMAEFQRERVILEVAILIRKLLKEKGLTKADLASRLGRSKAFITQLLDGRANMTLRTLSDLMCALGQSLVVSSGPLEVCAKGASAFTLVGEPSSRESTLKIDRSKYVRTLITLNASGFYRVYGIYGGSELPLPTLPTLGTGTRG